MGAACHQRVRPKRLALQIMLILVTAGALGSAANLLSPRRIPWRENWSNHVEATANKAGISVVDLVAAQRAVNAGTYIVLDARPSEAFEMGHLPGAISLPAANLEEQFGGIQVLLTPTSRLLVYCSGKTCDESLLVARFLREQGYEHVELFVDGFDAWQSAGLSVERGN